MSLSSESSPVVEPEIRHWPLQLVLRKQQVARGRWEVDHWSLLRCESDRQTSSCDELSCQPLSASEAVEDFQWQGLSLELFRDERSAYRFNISSQAPRLFVVCNEDEESELMTPFLVTASQDVAADYMDGGEEDVFSIAMPEAIQCWIEGFIGRHGEPDMAVGKGKRRNHGNKKKQPAKPSGGAA